MLSTRKLILSSLKFLLAFYVFICVLLFLFQEKIIFSATKLPADHRFSFDQCFEEIFVTTNDKERLHGLLFSAKNSKGLIFYLHGNSGAVDSWGAINETYTNLGYDIFLLDYRGFGKSSGTITSQAQLFDDVRLVYDSLSRRYGQENVIVAGYSIGTGPAAYLASVNRPQRLILQAPYFSLSDIMKKNYPFIPPFLLKYKFNTNEYLAKCRVPVAIFHGDEDDIIDYTSSLKLKRLLKQGDTLITLKNQGHNGMNDNPSYQLGLKAILAKR